MKTAGIVGGIAPESTIEYYRLLVAAYLDRDGNGNYPPIIINSINMKKMLDLIGENRLIDVTRYLASEVGKLAAAGADFVVMASNTPHIVFEDVQKASPIPMISIVAVTCDKARALGIQKVGLFGTKFTMKGGFYDTEFSRYDIEVVLPENDAVNYIHAKYMGELVKGIFLEDTRNALLDIVAQMKQSHGIQGLILGGTELPLILKESSDPDVPFLDTTRIHVEHILKRLF